MSPLDLGHIKTFGDLWSVDGMARVYGCSMLLCLCVFAILMMFWCIGWADELEKQKRSSPSWPQFLAVWYGTAFVMFSPAIFHPSNPPAETAAAKFVVIATLPSVIATVLAIWGLCLFLGWLGNRLSDLRYNWRNHGRGLAVC